MQKHDKKKNRDNNGVPEKYLGDKKPKKDKSDKKYDKNKNDKKHRDRERELKRRRKEKTLDAKTNQVIRRYKRMEKECRKTDIAKVILQQRQASFLSVCCMTNKAQAAWTLQDGRTKRSEKEKKKKKKDKKKKDKKKNKK